MVLVDKRVSVLREGRRAHDREVIVDERAVWRDEDRRLWPRGIEAPRELVHAVPRRRLRLLEDRIAVRGDCAEDDRHSGKRRDPLDDQLREPVAVDVDADFRVRGAEMLASAPVDVRTAPTRPTAAV